MTTDRIRTRVAPISKYQPFGYMTPIIIAVAIAAGVRLLFADAPKRWARHIGREVRRFVTGV
jgi:hypothetical protein